jgi:hypothetical protein
MEQNARAGSACGAEMEETRAMLHETNGAETFTTIEMQAAAAQERMLEALLHQTEVTEEIRDQFAEHLELQRQILRLLMAEKR